MAARVRILLSDVTPHVADPTRSVPLEFDGAGAIIRGAPSAREIPPMTIFEIDGDEADRILDRQRGLRIPDDVVDAVAYAKAQAAELGLPLSQQEKIRLA